MTDNAAEAEADVREIVVEQRRQPLFTPVSLAEYLAVSERTVRDLLARGEIPSYKLGGVRRIDPRDVDLWLEQRRQGRAD